MSASSDITTCIPQAFQITSRKQNDVYKTCVFYTTQRFVLPHLDPLDQKSGLTCRGIVVIFFCTIYRQGWAEGSADFQSTSERFLLPVVRTTICLLYPGLNLAAKMKKTNFSMTLISALENGKLWSCQAKASLILPVSLLLPIPPPNLFCNQL